MEFASLVADVVVCKGDIIGWKCDVREDSCDIAESCVLHNDVIVDVEGCARFGGIDCDLCGAVSNSRRGGRVVGPM